jgi:hypothetical protein
MKDSLTENFLDLKKLVFKSELEDYYDLSGKVVEKKLVDESTLTFVFTDGTDFNIHLGRIWNALVEKADALAKDDKEFRLIMRNLMEQYGYPLNMTAAYENKDGNLVYFESGDLVD